MTKTTHPEMAACILPADGSIVLVKRGEVGYWPAPMFHDDPVEADRYNERHGVTPAMRESMQMGSCFGWHVPGANPDRAEKLYAGALPLAQKKRRA